jgi:hypothetical protein
MVMQSVEYLHGWWVLRAGGRNPLVRASDRVELLIIVLGISAVLLAGAFAGALGTAVHDARSRVYIAQGQTRHTVTARAINDSTTVFGADGNTATRVNVRWKVDGTEYTDSFNVAHAVKTGDPLRIWVDRNGNRVDAPMPTSQAGVDAFTVAYAAWQTVALAVAGLIYWAHSRLEHRRASAWEREIRSFMRPPTGGHHNS